MKYLFKESTESFNDFYHGNFRKIGGLKIFPLPLNRGRVRFSSIILLWIILGGGWGVGSAPAWAVTTYYKDIKSIFDEECNSCHGNDNTTSGSPLVKLDTYEGATKKINPDKYKSGTDETEVAIVKTTVDGISPIMWIRIRGQA